LLQMVGAGEAAGHVLSIGGGLWVDRVDRLLCDSAKRARVK
jgi:hypothetical protein